jgi:O-acetyl-ADP-ribose deacetylase (regulator of RNase III)
MLPDRILLVARDAALAAAWAEAFEEVDGVAVHHGDLFAFPADAMVSPANSFGIMDGGLDRAIRAQLGFVVEERAQAAIVARHHGELPVGQAEVVPTDHPSWPHLVVAPTMRVPEGVAQTTHAYLSFRAALLAVARHNQAAAPPAVIRSVACPGLGTGIGGMSPGRCAVQMQQALRMVRGPARIPSYEMIHAVHRALKSR